MRTSALLLLFTLTSCMSWVPVELPAPQDPTQQRDFEPSPSQVWGLVRVHLDNGQRVELQNVALIGDLLWGELVLAHPDSGVATFAVPARRVTRVEVRQPTDLSGLGELLSMMAGTLYR